MASGDHTGQGTVGAFHYNKRLHQSIASVTPCADAQAAPNTLAGEANVIREKKKEENFGWACTYF